MPAVTFLFLLNEGYRILHADYRMRATLALLPHFKNDEDRNKLLRQLEWASQHPSDILGSGDAGETNYDNIEKLLRGN